MAKKCLVLYQSNTGNTEKVALKFKSTFEQHGWQCDAFRISRKTDLATLPELDNYDFLCVGSPVYGGLPLEEIKLCLIIMRCRGKLGHITMESFMQMEHGTLGKKAQKGHDGFRPTPHARIAFGPKKGVAFATYFGAHFGPKEAEPTLKWLELEMEHSRFRCIGSFCCPGRMNLVKGATPGAYHGDVRNRPNEKDLLKAEMFIEEMLENIGKA
jgi:flavodoxin